MKALLSSLVVVTSLAGAAHAADAVIDYQPAPVSYHTFVWTGFYAGVQGGYAFAGRASAAYDGSSIYDHNLDQRGWFGGVHGGYNHQLSNGWVVGAEADFNFARFSDTEENDESYVGTIETDWFGSARARVGYAMGNIMPFATAGLAFSDFQFTEHDLVEDEFTRFDDTLFGWTAGAGADFLVRDNLVLRAEYRYTHLSRGGFESTGDYSDDWSNGKLRTHDIRVGVSYKF